MESVNFTKSEITRLNCLIKEYHGKDYNVFLMQGLFISFLSSGKNTDDVMRVIREANTLIDSNNIEIDNEFARLLFDGLYNQTVKNNKKFNNITPMVNLECVRHEYINYLDLTEIEQRNLLDWYIGYFMGMERFWNFDQIESFISNPDLVFENISMFDYFFNALGTQQLIAYNLIEKFKPKYRDDFLQEVIKNIKDIGEAHSPRNKEIYNINATTCSCLLLSSILQITQASLTQLKELYNQPTTAIH